MIDLLILAIIRFIIFVFKQVAVPVKFFNINFLEIREFQILESIFQEIYSVYNLVCHPKENAKSRMILLMCTNASGWVGNYKTGQNLHRSLLKSHSKTKPQC